MADIVRLRDDAGAATRRIAGAARARRAGAAGARASSCRPARAASRCRYDSAFTPVDGFEPVPDGLRGPDGRRRSSSTATAGSRGSTSDAGADRRRRARSSSSRSRAAAGGALDGPAAPDRRSTSSSRSPASRTRWRRGRSTLDGARDEPRRRRATPWTAASTDRRRRPLDAGPGRQPHAARAAVRARRRAARRAARPQFFRRRRGASYRARPRDPAPLPALAGPGLPRPHRRRGRRHAPRVACSACRSRSTSSAASTAFPPLDQTKPFVLVDGLALGPRARRGRRLDRRRRRVVAGDRPGASADVGRRGPAGGADQRRRSWSTDRAVTADLAGDPLGLGRHRDPRARVARRPGVRVDRLPRQRDGVDLGAARRVRAAQGAGPRAAPAARCGSRSRTSLLLAIGPDPRARCSGLVLAWLVLPFATLTRHGRAAGPGAGRRRPARGR